MAVKNVVRDDDSAFSQPGFFDRDKITSWPCSAKKNVVSIFQSPSQSFKQNGTPIDEFAEVIGNVISTLGSKSLKCAFFGIEVYKEESTNTFLVDWEYTGTDDCPMSFSCENAGYLVNALEYYAGKGPILLATWDLADNPLFVIKVKVEAPVVGDSMGKDPLISRQKKWLHEYPLTT